MQGAELRDGAVDRDEERAALDRLVASIRAGGRRALVESGCCVVRTTGYQSEMELAFTDRVLPD
jgi:hypothetical protein